MGKTVLPYSFAGVDEWENTGYIVGRGRIDVGSNWAGNKVVGAANAIKISARLAGSLSPWTTHYIAYAFNRRPFDLKSKTPKGEGMYYGSVLFRENNISYYVSARGAGNILAGVVAAGERFVPHSLIFTAYGGLNTPPKSWHPFAKLFGGAVITALSYSQGIGNPYLYMKYFGEDELTAKHILWGYKNRARFVK